MIQIKQVGKFLFNLTSKLVLIILGVLFVSIATLVLVILLGSNDPKSLFRVHPTDEKLISNFYEHETEFEQLAELLISENTIEVIYPDSNNCQLSNQRMINSADNPSCANFIKMFQLLGLDWAFTKLHANNENLWLTVSSSGISVSGSSKGYYYSKEGIQPSAIIAEDTDKANGREMYRHIKGNWYIFILR